MAPFSDEPTTFLGVYCHLSIGLGCPSSGFGISFLRLCIILFSGQNGPWWCFWPQKGGREVEEKNPLPLSEKPMYTGVFSDLVEVEENLKKISEWQIPTNRVGTRLYRCADKKIPLNWSSSGNKNMLKNEPVKIFSTVRLAPSFYSFTAAAPISHPSLVKTLENVSQRG